MHIKQWKFLEGKYKTDSLSHAYIFSGEKGIGKKDFALEFVKFLDCKFPDFKVLSATNDKDYSFGDGGEIKVAQIREAQNFLSYKSYNGGFKVLIVEDSENMNSEAQNCFLKTLEEPKGQTLLILISSKPDLLLPTIFSRCQTVKFFKPKGLVQNAERAKKEKEILDNFIPVVGASFAEKFKYVKGLNFSASDVKANADKEKQDPVEILKVIQKYYREMLLKDYTQKKVIKILELIDDIISKLTFTNANPKLALEILLMEI